MSRGERGLPWREAAEQITHTLTEWVCKTCNRRWGNNERMARYCCASTSHCEECSAEMPGKAWIKCEVCRDKEDHEKWNAKTEIDWDGEFPIAIWNDDRYFFDMESFVEYLEELSADSEDGRSPVQILGTLRMTTCRRDSPPTFELCDLFQDHLEEDQEPPENRELEQQVNNWIAANAPELWWATGERINMAQLALAVHQNLNAE